MRSPRVSPPGPASDLDRHGPEHGPRRRRVGIRPVADSALVGTVGLALLAAGCGYGRAARPDRIQPVPWADTLPIREPRERAVPELKIVLEEATAREAGRALAVDRWTSGIPPALNVTAFDGVVPSAWFVPRAAVHPLDPAEVAQGPPGPEPAPDGPLTVIAAKSAGVTPGFTVRDGAGNIFLLKFDPPGYPGLASGADVVSSRLFWAAGYYAPHDVVLAVDPERLVVGDGVTLETAQGERAMRQADVQRILEKTDARPDGRYRALASAFVPGTPKGPWRFEGTREEDPNDYYPHEHRRELRGVWVLAAWLNHVDLQARNTLDVFVEPTGYLRHYLIDFGTTLGSGSIRPLSPREGREYAFDLWPFLARIPTLGRYRVGWEDEDDEPIHPALGQMAVEEFDPVSWKPFWPNAARRNLSAADGYWGAKLVAAFEEPHLRAVVDEARYPEAAADTLVDILLLRRERVLRHWFGRVAPVEDVRLETGGEASGDGELVVSFRDLGLEEGLWTPEGTRYEWRLRDGGAGAEFGGVADAVGRGRQEIRVSFGPGGGLRRAGSRAELELRVRREGAEERAAVVTFEWNADAGGRVVGVAH